MVLRSCSVIYECVGRMPHGKLGIADGAISISEKETIKTRKRCAQPNATAREKRLEMGNKELRKENDRYHELQWVICVVNNYMFKKMYLLLILKC